MTKMEDKYKFGLVGIIIAVLIFGYYNMWFADYGWAPTVTTYQPPYTPPVTTPPTTGGVPVGTYTMKDVAYNALDISSALTLGTNVDQSFYANRGGGWVLLGGHGASGTDIEITTQDNGYIYVLCQPHSTQTYIFDAAKALAMNSRAVSVQFIDVTGDTTKEFMVKYSMFNIPAAASGYPSTTFTGYYYSEDSASASFPAGGQPADISSIGSTKCTKFLAWYMSLSAEKKALAVYKVEFKINSTDSAAAELKNINVPSKGLIAASSMSYQKTDSYQIWTYTIGSTLGDCAYWELPANSNNKFDLTASIQLTMGSGDVYVATLTVYQLSYAQATVTDADSATLKQAS